MTAVAAAAGADRLGDPTALTGGYSAAFAGAALLAAGGAVIAALTLQEMLKAAPAAVKEAARARTDERAPQDDVVSVTYC